MDENTALDLIQEDYEGDEYEVVEGYVDDGHAKHDSTHYYSIFLRKEDNTYWKVSFTCSYDWGIDEYSVRVDQVVKKEVITTKWVTCA